MTPPPRHALIRSADRLAERPTRLFLVAMLCITAAGWADHVTGTRISLSFFYAIPIAAATWYLGLRAGVGLAVMSAVIGFMGNVAEADVALGPLAWNVAARALILLFIAWVVARMHSAMLRLEQVAERERLIAERLRASDELKNMFLSAVSHELRTPLTAILGSARTIEDLGGRIREDDRRELLSAIGRNARKLDRLVSDLLDVDRVTRGATVLDRIELDLGRLAEGVLDSMDLPHDRLVHLTAPRVVAHVDGGKVERILENLVANALKYSPEDAEVWVVVTTYGGAPCLLVEDSGPGVAPADREAVFEPFHRVDRGTRVPGVGLGLSLVRAFAELHGGHAWVDERPGGGARFVVTFPDPVDPGPALTGGGLGSIALKGADPSPPVAAASF
jgi:signal transduction histidine kinase